MSNLVEFLRARLADDAAEIAKHPDGEDDWPGHELSAITEPYSCFPRLLIHKRRALAEAWLRGLLPPAQRSKRAKLGATPVAQTATQGL